MTAVVGGWRLGGGEIEQKGERAQGQQCDCMGGFIRGINGNGKIQ